MKHALVCLLVIAGCRDDEPDVTPCERLRDHLIDLRLKDSNSVDENAHRTALRASMGDDFLAACASMPDAPRACALAAASSLEAMRCSDSQTTRR